VRLPRFFKNSRATEEEEEEEEEEYLKKLVVFYLYLLESAVGNTAGVGLLVPINYS
jgi:hypothetical protein